MKGQSNTGGSEVVYEIRCICNNKVYIGQTIDFNRRCKEHIKELTSGIHTNRSLQEDFNKFSISNFKFTILEQLPNRQLMKLRETYYINLNGGIYSENVYNMQDNINQNENMRRLNSEGQKGRSVSESTRSKISNTEKLYYKCNGGDHDSAFKGKHHSKESKQVISEKLKLNAIYNPNFGMRGKHHSEKSKQLMSEKGKLRADKIRAKLIKYTPDIIEEMRQKYKELGTYKKVGEFYNISPSSIFNLLKYGTTSKNKKCNDYPIQE